MLYSNSASIYLLVPYYGTHTVAAQSALGAALVTSTAVRRVVHCT